MQVSISIIRGDQSRLIISDWVGKVEPRDPVSGHDETDMIRVTHLDPNRCIHAFQQDSGVELSTYSRPTVSTTLSLLSMVRTISGLSLMKTNTDSKSS